LVIESEIVRNVDGSTTTTQHVHNGDTSLRSTTVTSLSADGKSRTVETDSDGNSTFEVTTTDVKVENVDGSTTQTVARTNADTSLRDKQVTTWSADGKTRTVSTDTDGDGNDDRIQTVEIVSGESVDTQSVYSPDGQTLIARTITTTSAD